MINASKFVSAFEKKTYAYVLLLPIIMTLVPSTFLGLDRPTSVSCMGGTSLHDRFGLHAIYER